MIAENTALGRAGLPEIWPYDRVASLGREPLGQCERIEVAGGVAI